MNEEQCCPECGSALSGGSAEGLCHKCLLAAVVPEVALENALRIRCPHCNNAVEIVGESNVTDVTCPSCHSSFGLIGKDGGEWQKPSQLGRFKIAESIGTGSFGTVYKAHDPELDRTVAIKIPRQRRDAELFLKEAQSAAQLNHPNIVSVHEVGQDHETFFIVADLVDGEDLASWLSSNKATIEDAVLFCQQVANALEHAHSVGVIHRDLKPANILLAADKSDQNDGSQLGDYTPKVTDFGLAKRDAGEITMTAPGKILGTPAYMSPEQAVGDGFQADARSDVYSLGVILFELLTGEKPFRGNLQMLLQQVQEEDPPRPRKLNNRIPVDLETITLKCLEKRPEARYETAAELNKELQRFEEGRPIQARPVSFVERTWRWCRRNPIVAGLASLAVILLISVAVVSTVSFFNAKRQTEELAGVTTELRAQQYAESISSGHYAAARLLEADRVQQILNRWHPGSGLSGTAEKGGYNQDKRGWEWYLLNSYFHRYVAKLNGHNGSVEDVGWSHDGQFLTSVGDDGMILIRDGSTRRELARVENAHSARIWTISWHPSEMKFATGGDDGKVCVWDEAGSKLTEFDLEKTVGHLEWRARDGLLLAGSDTCLVSFLNVQNGTVKKTLEAKQFDPKSRGVLGLDWSDKHGLVIAIDNSDENCMRIWNEENEAFEDIEVLNDDTHCVSWQPNGDLVAAAGKAKQVVVWNQVTKQVDHSFDCRLTVVDATWHLEHPWLAIVSHDSTVSIWNQSTNDLKTFTGHRGAVLGVDWRPGTSELASAGADGTVRVWTMDHHEKAWDYNADHFGWSPDGSQLATIVGAEIHILDMPTGKVRVLEDRLLEQRGQRQIAWSRDGSKIATSDNPKSEPERGLVIWDVETGKQINEVGNWSGDWWTNWLEWHPDGKRLLYHGGLLRLLDSRSGEVLHEKTGVNGGMSTFSPDGKLVLSLVPPSNSAREFGGELLIWETETGKELKRIEELVTSAFFDPSGKFIVGGRPNGARIWNVETGEQIADIMGQTNVTAPAWSPDGSRIATADNFGLVKIWDAKTQRLLVTLDSEIRDVIGGIRWSPDGKKLVVRGYFAEGKIRIWDASAGYEHEDAPLEYDPETTATQYRFF